MSDQQWTLDRIDAHISGRIQENLHLEYKACADLQGNVNLPELTKDVSAFANADGGTVIFGVSEGRGDEKHLPVKRDDGFERGGKVNANWLENILLANIAPKIQGLKPYEVELEDGRFLLVLEIPQSQYGPHMAKDHKYYKRRETKSDPMEHYEVEDVRNRSRGPLLKLNLFFDHEEFTPIGIKRKFFETERSFPIKLFAENLVSQPAEYGAVNFYLDFQLRERDKMLQSKMFYSDELGLALDGRYGFYRHYFQIGLPHNAPIWKENPVLVKEIPFSFPRELNAIETFYFGWDLSSPHMPRQKKFYQMQTIIDRPGTTSIYDISEI